MTLIELTPSPFFIINICPVYMKVYARFGESNVGEIVSKALKDLKETKRYGRRDG